MSADLSWADVAKGTEVKKEIVVGEGRLCVGYAAVVTCRGKRRDHHDGLLTSMTASLNRDDSAHNTDILCTYMSFEAEKVPSPRSLESLQFLQRDLEKK